MTFEGDEQIYLKYAELSRRGERASSRDAANPVLMGLANEADYPHRGSMVFVDNQVDPRTGTIRARAAFDNKDGYLTPGLFARVKLLGHNSYHAVLVDDRAIGTDQSQKFVYVVDAQNKVTYRAGEDRPAHRRPAHRAAGPAAGRERRSSTACSACVRVWSSRPSASRWMPASSPRRSSR